MEKYCRARGLNTEDAMDRSRWRKQIGMIDDHDELTQVVLDKFHRAIERSCVCVCVCM